MNRKAELSPTFHVHIVDTAVSPYQRVFQPWLSSEVSLAFHGTSSAALRAARQSADGVWFVSTELPDLPGTQLIEMLGGLSGDKLIVAVGDTYSPRDETAALASGASQYFVKPLVSHRCKAVIDAYRDSELAPVDCEESLEIHTVRS